MIREEMEQGRKKANRNKTIDFSLEEGRKYLDSCLYISKEKPEPITCEMLKNQLIVGGKIIMEIVLMRKRPRNIANIQNNG